MRKNQYKFTNTVEFKEQEEEVVGGEVGVHKTLFLDNEVVTSLSNRVAHLSASL